MMIWENILLAIVSFGARIVYDKRGEILELSKTNKAVRYMIMPFAVPVAIMVIAILFYMIRKNPDFLTWSDPQKKLTEYF